MNISCLRVGSRLKGRERRLNLEKEKGNVVVDSLGVKVCELMRNGATVVGC
jgi:hypothetical protein